MYRLSDEAYAILNDAERIARRDEWFARMRALFDGRPHPYNDSRVFTLHGYYGGADNAYTDPEGWAIRSLEALARIPEPTADRFSPACIEYGIYGVHYIDRMFGADVFQMEDGSWQAHYLTTPVGELTPPDLDHDETWALTRRAAQAFVDADVKLPLLGTPTLSSALNIIVNLYGQDILLAMAEDEQAAMHDLVIVNDLIRALHRWFIANVPEPQLQPVIAAHRTQPPGYGQVCGCTCQLLSASMYRDMIAPLDDAVLADHPGGGMIHLCGAHAQHIPAFRSMKHLRALQLNDRAAHDLELYLDGLREDQIIYLNPCEGMSVKKAMAISGGKRIVICESMDAPDKRAISQ